MIIHYTELKEHMKEFHLGKISKLELSFYIAMWQKDNNFDIKN